MKKHFYTYHFIVILLGLLLLIGFQNCSKGFKANSFSESLIELLPSVGDTEEESAQPVAPVPIFEAKMMELQSVSVAINSTGDLSFPDGLPKGSHYNPNTGRFNWIPKRGQAGKYKFRIFDNDQDIGFIDLEVGALTEAQLRAGGPPATYADGDVGYIFVHGKGALDRCSDPGELARYWGNGPAIVAPDAATRFVACYDGRKAVRETARGVAEQILNANCGRFHKCIIFTHSMGGLMLEFMFLHTRAPMAADPDPSLFADRELFQAVKDRTLFVVSLASAAGGSLAASIINSDGGHRVDQEATGAISRILGANDDATKNLVINHATRVVAPITEDPQVPFFMVPGFTEKTAAEADGILSSIFALTFNQIPLVVFNGNRELALLDSYIQFPSRSDGLVDFRSSCGVASTNEDEGPGRSAAREEHFRYCYTAPKKPNHYVWFLSNLNHYLITGQPYNCRNTEAACVTLFPNPEMGTFMMDPTLTGMSAMEVARFRLASPMLLRGLASAQ